MRILSSREAQRLVFVVVVVAVFKILFIYLAEREHKQAEQQGEGEAGSPLSREPHMGLHLRTLGS